jgi:hypothetical protein
MAARRQVCTVIAVVSVSRVRGRDLRMFYRDLPM